MFSHPPSLTSHIYLLFSSLIVSFNVVSFTHLLPVSVYSCSSPAYLLSLSISILSRISPSGLTDVSPLFIFLPSDLLLFSPYHSYSPGPFTYLPSPLVFLPQVSLLSLPSPFSSPCLLISMAPFIYPSTLTHDFWGNW